jgi:hypothetical protein
MKKTLLQHSLLAGIAVISVLAIAPLTVEAETMDHETTTGERREAAQKEAEARREAARAKADEAKTETEARRTEAKSRLQDAKLRACEKRQAAIVNIMKRMSDRGQKQVDLFSSIADRTQAFYEKKGKTLANYDALVANVAAKKESAQESVAMTSAHGTSFDCGGEDPKGDAASFKEHRKLAIAALKDYKAAVKDLIVGVKSAQGAASSESERE